jgi:preprotein translocase subunit SecD
VTDLELELRQVLTEVADRVSISPNPWAAYEQRGARRPSRNSRLKLGLSLGAIAAATAAIVVSVVVLASGGGTNRPAELTGGQTFTLTPHTRLSTTSLAVAARIITKRLSALGVKDVEVRPRSGGLEAQIPASARSTLTVVADTRGMLRFRQALADDAGQPTPATDSHRLPTSAAESPTLSRRFLNTYHAWDCTKPATRNATRGADQAADYIIACAPDGITKYLLAPSTIDNTQISSANAALGTTKQWMVDLTFTSTGAQAWQQLTKTAYDVNNGQPPNTTIPCAPPTGCDEVAIVLDGVVQSAPYISQAGGISSGTAQITGGFTQRSATELADILKYGALATTFHITSN